MAEDRRERDRLYRINNRESIREHDRQRWIEKKRRGIDERTMELQRIQHRAKYFIALKDKCELCDSPATDRHHDDYSKPLEVRHLCRSCHMNLHEKLRREGEKK